MGDELRVAFVPAPLSRIALIARQAARGVRFWTGVLKIWASFKLTQMYIALSPLQASKTWVDTVWEQRHREAAQVWKYSAFDSVSVTKHRFVPDICTDMFVSKSVEHVGLVLRNEGKYSWT